MRLFWIPILLLIVNNANAGKILGRITDINNQPIAFSSVIVKGTGQGTSANSTGNYSLQLASGDYTLIAQHVGYKSIEKRISVINESQELNFQLPEQQYNLGNVIVKKGEDAAYQIMRNAIKKRSYHESEIKKFTAEVYIKGQIQLRNFPNKFMGQDVDFEDGDTSKRKIIFLSESVAKYSVNEPNRKVEVLSTKVSGSKDGFGFSSPQIFSFYANNIRLGDLNPRGFISPLATNALNYYRYKFEGSFFENSVMINRIKVIPKRNFEPVFSGYINIIENSWRIHSVQLMLLKENQMQIADTVRIEQLYVPLQNTWVIKQQTLYPSINVLGFKGFGNFVQVYDKFDLNPSFSKRFFDNTILKYTDSANKKTGVYWDSVRPVPLLHEELVDYKKKDSLEQAQQDPHYLDSLDKKRNKINTLQLITTGKSFGSSKNKTTINIQPLIDIIAYNTVEGVVVNFKPTYQKSFSDLKRNALSITPGIRYGFTNKHFNPNLTVSYRYGSKLPNTFTISGGRDVFQYNPANPVLVFGNSIRTLNSERNYLKIFEAGYGRLDLVKAIGNGITISTYFEYQDRLSLDNTTLHKWKDFAEREFTPNITQPNHKASIVSLSIRWRPGTKYVEFPERKVSVGSKYPTFNITLTKGINKFLESDVDYAKYLFSVNDDLDLKLAGRFGYRISAGGFLNAKSAFIPDYNHYFSTQTTVAAPYLSSFQLMPYYTFSNKEKFYSAAHFEYHLNGLITNKIPLFKKLNWFIVTGTNLLYLKTMNYGEVFIGLENIFKIGRLDYVQTLSENGYNSSGFRYTIQGIISR